MSLDVSLISPQARARAPRGGIFVRESGARIELTAEQWSARHPGCEPVMIAEPAEETFESREVFSANITHNLTKMASAAGLYEALWHPEAIGARKARDLISPLQAGLARLSADPERFKPLNPANGWGSYEGLVAFAADYLAACGMNPDAEISISR